VEDVSSQLLDNALDNLDRLYDGLCTPADTHALLLASAHALSDEVWSARLVEAADAIKAYRHPDLGYPGQYTDPAWRDHALTATDDLRKALAAR
jgi:hypothetical protein